MSEHGRTGSRDQDMRVGLRNAKAVSDHRGSPPDVLVRHKRHVDCVLQEGKEGLLEIAPRLLHRISDERTLCVAWDYLAEYGGQAPGPDGLRYGDLNQQTKWCHFRKLRDEIRAGTYSPGKERLQWIPKRSGKGSRPLILQDIEDRVVQRATVEILQPLLDPRFDPFSFGFRPRRGVLDALACAERLALDQQRWVWIAVDIKDAFSNVPVQRLLDMVRKRLPDDELVRFINRILDGATLGGLRQGGPLSPLLLNLYLDHFLDRKWQKLFPRIPLIRYADDVLLLCRTRKEASNAYAALVNILKPTGMTLKEDAQQAISRLDRDRKASYMGFEIGKGHRRLRVGLSRAAWDGLADSLEQAHEAPASPMRAWQTIVGWLGQRGPCYVDQAIDVIYSRLARIARQYAFDELLYPCEVDELTSNALKRWRAAQQSAEALHGKPEAGALE